MKKGYPDTLTPEVSAEMERMWSRTAMHHEEIARRLNERFGTTFSGKNIEWHARRRVWTRQMMSKSFNHRSLVEERLATKSLLRSNRISREDNPVRHVPPGTHKHIGYRMGITS